MNKPADICIELSHQQAATHIAATHATTRPGTAAIAASWSPMISTATSNLWMSQFGVRC